MNNKKILKIYFDTEFTGLTQNTTLISIGMITDNGEMFYAEFNDYNTKMVTPWIQENVIDRLILKETQYLENLHYFIYGNKTEIAKAFIKWLAQLRHKNGMECCFQFVSDVSHYDFILLINLLVKDALKLPKCISPYCHDINQDIAKYFNVSDYEAFDINRESIISDKYQTDQVFENLRNEKKHNSLWDACVICLIDQIVNNNPDVNINFDVFNKIIK